MSTLKESVFVVIDPHIGQLLVQDSHLLVHAPAGIASICITQLLFVRTLKQMDNQNHHLEIILLQIDKDRNHLTDSRHAQHILHHLLQHSVILQLAVLLHVSHRSNILLCHQIDLHLVNDIQICRKQT